MPINGIWYSSIGSELKLEEHGSELKGSFDSVQQPGKAFELHGSVYPNEERPNRSLSFSVAWPEDPASAKYRSVSSYTGQYHHVDGVGEFIDVVFLLVDETMPSRSFASVFVGHDRFMREKPGPARIDMDLALREASTSRQF
jgi:hypothetical protein